VELEVERVPPYRITLRGVVYESMFYGPKYRLTTELTTLPGSTEFTVRDTVTNIGGQPQELYLLYHINQGPPLLEAGARLIAPIKKIMPRDGGYTDGEIVGFDRCTAPRHGSKPQVFYATLNGDAEGRTGVLFRDASSSNAVSIEFRLDELP